MVCPAKSLQLGDNGTYSLVVHDSGTATFQNDGLKLVKGAWWFNCRGDLELAGPLTVLSPATEPFGLFYGQVPQSNNVATISGSITGDSTSGLIFGWMWKNYEGYFSARKSTFNLTGDISNFKGTMYVRADEAYQSLDGGEFGTKLVIPASTGSCSIDVGKGCWLRCDGAAQTTTVARLKFAAATRYEPKATGWYTYGKGQSAISCLKATEELTVAGPVEIYYSGDIRGTGLFRLPILMGPASSTFTAEDFTLVKAKPESFYNLDLHFEVGTDPATGMRTLYAVSYGFVYMSGKSYADEGTRDWGTYASSLTNAAAWWDGQVPHAGSAYRVGGKWLRSLWAPQEDYVFPGVSFWLQSGAGLMLNVKSFFVPTFYASDGENTIQLPAGSLSVPVTLKANRFSLQDSVILRAHVGHALVLDGPIDGNADISMQGTGGTGQPKAFYELRGINTNFTGTVSVTMDEYRAQYVSFTNQFPTLAVNDGRNLGGRRSVFTPRALTLTHMARLSVTNAATVTLADDLNRGVYILEKGRFHADKATTVLDVRQPILLSGHLWTEGEGTVVLGGAMSFEQTDGGTIVEVPRAGSNLVTVASKVLKAAHPDCLNGCDVTFEAESKLVLDVDKLGTTGLRMTRTGSMVRLDPSFGGKLPVAVVTARDAPENPQSATLIPLVTVPDGDLAAAVRAMMPRIPRIWPAIAQQVVEWHDEANGLTTFVLNVQNKGMLVIFR